MAKKAVTCGGYVPVATNRKCRSQRLPGLSSQHYLSPVDAELDEPVSIVEPHLEWTQIAARLTDECRAACAGEASVAVEHIGSTAVPGLAAKPVIDLMVGVRSGRREAVAAQLAAAGWTLLGEAGVPGRVYLRRRLGQHANVHVVDLGSPLWEDNLLLRDYLRRDAQARIRYGHAKRRAAEEAPMLLAYSAAKQQVVASLMHEARHG